MMQHAQGNESHVMITAYDTVVLTIIKTFAYTRHTILANLNNYYAVQKILLLNSTSFIILI